MQISAANLLVAAGAPRATNAPSGARPAFAAALNETKAQPAKTAVQFAPQSFEAESAGAPEEPAPTRADPAAAAPASPRRAGGYGSAPALGSQLDIRV